MLVEQGDSFATVLGKLHAAGDSQGPAHSNGRRSRANSVPRAGCRSANTRWIPGRHRASCWSRMREGKVISHRFTIVEGWNVRELRAALAKAPLLRHDASALDDAALMKALGHPGEHPEGRFLPETYAYTRGDGELRCAEARLRGDGQGAGRRMVDARREPAIDLEAAGACPCVDRREGNRHCRRTSGDRRRLRAAAAAGHETADRPDA